MPDYPLSYSVSPLLSSDRLQVKDAKKNTLFIVPAADEEMKKGLKPYLVYRDKDKKNLACQILAAKTGGQEKDDQKTVYSLSGAQGDPLGKVVQTDSGWEIHNSGGQAVAQIKEKGLAEESCLGCLLSILDIFGLLFFLVSPHRYEVEINGQAVLRLQQADYRMADSYRLKALGEFFPPDEDLLLLSLGAVLLD